MKGAMNDMSKLDPTVRKETLYICAWVLILSVVMQAVFLMLGRWGIDVLLGNLLSGICACLNFLLMGITVQQALEKDSNDAKTAMKFSQTMRIFMQFAFGALGVIFFNPIASIVPLFFPRIAVSFRPLMDKHTAQPKSEKGGE